MLWTVGIVVFGVGDIVYAYRLAFDHYVSGTWLDALWAVGVVVFAVGRGPDALRRPAHPARCPLAHRGGDGRRRRRSSC